MPVIVKFGYVPEMPTIPAPVKLTVTSGSVFVMVIFDVLPAREIPVPAVCVTSEPVELLRVNGEEVPV